MVFDDTRVEPYNTANLEEDWFGGIKPMQEFERTNSAYILLYERSTPVDVIEVSNGEARISEAVSFATIEGGAWMGKGSRRGVE